MQLPKEHGGILDVRLVCGDFLNLDLQGPFDYIVSADSLAHMHDQNAAIRKIARLLRPDGIFLLMTQNAQVWRRRSRAKALGKGQIQLWPSMSRCRAMLEPWFRIERVTSMVPGGDEGLLWWVENRWVNGAMRRLVGMDRWRAALEAARLGRELVFVARRNTRAL